MNKTIDQLCDNEIQPTVIDIKPETYKAGPKGIVDCALNGYGNGMFYSGLVFFTEGLATGDYGHVGISMASISLGAGIIALAKMRKQRNIDSLVQDYIKSKEEKQ